MLETYTYSLILVRVVNIFLNIIVYDYIYKILIGIDLFTVLFRTYYILYDFIAYTHHLKFQPQSG